MWKRRLFNRCTVVLTAILCTLIVATTPIAIIVGTVRTVIINGYSFSDYWEVCVVDGMFSKYREAYSDLWYHFKTGELNHFTKE